MMTASSSKDSSQDTTSITMPSGVSGFLLDCLEADSQTLNTDSTLSSIEEFRRAENCAEGMTEVGLMNSVKNSTLLDVSHAEDIVLHQPPNLSSILELSLDTAEDKRKNSFTLSPISLSPVQVCGPSEFLRCSGVTSGCVLKPSEKRTPVNVMDVGLSPAEKKQCFAEKEKTIKYRKVMFSDIVSIRNISSHERNKRCHQLCGAQQDKLDEHKKVKNMSVASKDISSAPAKFFDFADECEREAFFQRLKQTHSFQFPAKVIISTVSPASETTSFRKSVSNTEKPAMSSSYG